ncbi:tetratricopeptide repeat protein [Pseudoalteromonas sp.]|uniref:tetratricopeptide repeat protein n=1 Tax=Pseudoalteromonas sp. TaxID=53249 RepID=UPI003567D706
MNYYTHKNIVIILVTLVLFSAMGCSSTNNANRASAKEQANSASNLAASKQALITSALEEESNNQWQKAIYFYIQALELAPEDVALLYQVGVLQNRLNNPKLAMRAFTKAIEIDPQYGPALGQVGISYLEQQQLDKARNYLYHAVLYDQQRLNNADIETAIVPLDQDSPLLAYNAYAVIKDMDNQHTYAQDVFITLLGTQRNQSLIYTNLGYSYYLTNNYKQAQYYYKKALDHDPHFKRAKLNLGLIYVRYGQYNSALRLFKQVMTEAQAYNDIGYLLMLDGRLKESEYFLQTAVELSPSYYKKGNINLQNTQSYLRQGQTNIALPYQSNQ